MTFTYAAPPEPISTDAPNRLNPYAKNGHPAYWQESCLRSRGAMTLVFPQSPLTSTPIPNMSKEYGNNNGIFMYHQQRTSYYNNYPPSATSTVLTQVLSTYVPGATVLCLDPKDKQTLRVAPRLRLIFLAALIFLGVLGGVTCFWTKADSRSQTVVEEKILVALPKNSSSTGNQGTLPPVLRPLVVPSSRPERIQAPPIIRPQVIYSFDDEDADNEARVETFFLDSSDPIGHFI